MKKIIRGILVIIIVLVAGYPKTLKALETGSNIGGGYVSEFVKCVNGSKFCWNSAPAVYGERIQAIRVSVVDKNGNRWPGTKSLDFFKYDDEESRQVFQELSARKYTNYYSGKLYTRNEIINNYLTNEPTRTFGDYTKRVDSSGNSTIVLLKENAFKNYNGVAANVIKPYFLGLDEEVIKKVYLEPLGLNYEEELEKLKTDPEHFKNILLLIEPVVYFRLSSFRGGDLNFSISYAGTVTEVANMLAHDKDNGYNGPDTFFDLIRKYKTYRGYHFNGHTPFNKDYPLAIYIDSYVREGGLQGIKKWIEQNYTDNYAGEILTANGVAGGHVRLDEVIDVCPAPGEITNDDLPQCCDDLVAGNAYNSSNYFLCCKELYNAGKLTSSHLPTCCSVLPTNDSLYRNYCTTAKGCWKLNASCPDDCTNQTKGYVEDTDDWDCIFKSLQADRSNIRNHYFASDFESSPSVNPYCDYYCREEVNYQLPQGEFTVLAGNHFTVGYMRSDSWTPIRFEGTSECRTNGIDFQQFQRDYDYWNSLMVQRWNELQTAIALQNSINDHECSSEKNCNRYCVKQEERCTVDKETGTKTCRDVCVKWEYLGYTCTSNPAMNGVYGPENYGSWCSTSGTPSAGVEAKRHAYQQAKENRDRALSYIKQCNDWKRNYNTFLPRVYLNYEEEMYGIKNFELTPSINSYTYSDYYVGSGFTRNAYRRTLTTTSHSCGSTGSYCSSGSITYPANDNVRQFSIRTVNYHLPSWLYRYVEKPSGFSTSTKPFGQYLDLGYGNLPIHYSRKEGNYDISLKYTTFGTNHKFNQYVFNGVSFTGVSGDVIKCSNFYDCYYQVKNEYIECPSGQECEKLRVVFRPISLSNPFPGKNGTGREPGSNWRWSVSTITHNRGLSDPEKIFTDKEPMYQITLTPRLILNIRSYNRNQDGGYGDFKLKCIEGTGRECKSSFIRETYRTYFSGCGLLENWNACK